MLRALRIGDIRNLEDVKTALRDIENVFADIQAQAAATIDAAPANTQVLVRKSDGTYEIWDLVSTGGCTITKNAALKRIEISVP